MSAERWLPVVGFEGLYEVSDLGRVRSLDRVVVCSGPVKGTYPSLKKGRMLRPGPSTGGHPTVVLGRGKTRCVHTLVLLAFVGPRPARHDARHLDGDETNNRLSNLTWGSRGDNSRDKKWHNGAATYKLTPKDIIHIKRALRAPYHGIGVDLAERFGVSDAVISSIKHGRLHIDVRID